MTFILQTLQRMTIGGNKMKTLMNIQHQRERNHSNKRFTTEQTKLRENPNRGREPQTKRGDPEYEEYYNGREDKQYENEHQDEPRHEEGQQEQAKSFDEVSDQENESYDDERDQEQN